jgi:hypothetical protein
MTFVFAIPLGPEKADRLAPHNELEIESEGVHNQYDDDSPAEAVEPWSDFLRKYAKVQQDDCDLGHRNGALVHERGDVEIL